ncbi:MAG: hypothetical protein JNM72_05395 [Deltaproteobacteria bacterium]|nr:hypothetical protein [Deltaproteobacteria bacterium]
MTTGDLDFLRSMYRQFDPIGTAAGDAEYLPFYSRRELSAADPVDELLTTISWAKGESYQLFSGFRGTGKTTELKRLKRELTADGAHFVVLHIDTQSYLNLSTPIDVSDFLFAAAGAIDDELATGDRLAERVSSESVWTRIAHFLVKTQVDLSELGLSPNVKDMGISIKANLKADPTFKQRLQTQMAGHLGALTKEVHEFIRECVRRVRSGWGPDWQLVVLFDSLEQLAGTFANATEVEASAVNLFQIHAEKLHLPGVHVVYTVPPWLKVRAPAIGARFHGFQQIPCVKVKDRHGQPFQPGLDALAELVARRMPAWDRLFADRAALDRLSLASGGYLRDLFRLIQSTLRHARSDMLPVQDDVIKRVIDELRNSYLPITVEDARWLVNIADTHAIDLSDTARLGKLARLYDNLLVMTYRNGKEWVNAHPLVIDEARAMVARNPLPPAQSA